MGKFSENLGKAADNAERLASAMQSIPSMNSDAGSGDSGGSSGIPVIPTNVVFNTTVNTGGRNGAGNFTTSSPGVGGGNITTNSGSQASQFSNDFLGFLRSRGITSPDILSKQTIAYLMKEFERLLAKNSALGLAIRSSGGA